MREIASAEGVPRGHGAQPLLAEPLGVLAIECRQLLRVRAPRRRESRRRLVGGEPSLARPPLGGTLGDAHPA